MSDIRLIPIEEYNAGVKGNPCEGVSRVETSTCDACKAPRCTNPYYECANCRYCHASWQWADSSPFFCKHPESMKHDKDIGRMFYDPSNLWCPMREAKA